MTEAEVRELLQKTSEQLTAKDIRTLYVLEARHEAGLSLWDEIEIPPETHDITRVNDVVSRRIK